MFLGQSISAFLFEIFINMPMVGFESCINDYGWFEGWSEGPDPEIRGLKTWNPVMRILTKFISRHPKIRKKNQSWNPEFKNTRSRRPEQVLPPSNLCPTFILAKSLLSLSTIFFYAPFMGIMIYSLCVRSSVRPSVCPGSG